MMAATALGVSKAVRTQGKAITQPATRAVMERAASPVPRVTRQHPVRVYLAGQYSKRRTLETRADELEERGATITHRWMSYEEGHSPTQVASYAFEDIRAVQTADLVIAVMDDPKYAYRGTFGEVCAGLALQKPVIILTPEHSGPKWYCETNVFYWHPSVQHVETWEQVLALYDQMHRVA